MSSNRGGRADTARANGSRPSSRVRPASLGLREMCRAICAFPHFMCWPYRRGLLQPGCGAVRCLTRTLFHIKRWHCAGLWLRIISARELCNVPLPALHHHHHTRPVCSCMAQSTRKEAAEQRQKQAFSRDPMSFTIHLL